MSDDRKAIDTELAKTVVPELRRRGFKGSMPHYRRANRNAIELLTFQFDRTGGGFVIEISRSSQQGFTTHWGQVIAPSKLNAHDLHPYQRKRIKPLEEGGTESWFRYDTPASEPASERVRRAAMDALRCLVQAEAWWESENQRGPAPERAPSLHSSAAE